MDEEKTQEVEAHDSKNPAPRNIQRNILFSIVIIACLLSLVALFIPTLDGPNSRRAARESVAVGNVRRITTLQRDYADSHPTEGFACRLPLLKPESRDGNNYDAGAFLLSEDYAGYRIAIVGCKPEQNGLVSIYQIAAVPLEPGKSGVRAFCSDQTGALWYDASGSAENCLALHRTIE
jgi:hypothetical protein